MHVSLLTKRACVFNNSSLLIFIDSFIWCACISGICYLERNYPPLSLSLSSLQYRMENTESMLGYDLTRSDERERERGIPHRRTCANNIPQCRFYSFSLPHFHSLRSHTLPVFVSKCKKLSREELEGKIAR